MLPLSSRELGLLSRCLSFSSRCSADRSASSRALGLPPSLPLSSQCRATQSDMPHLPFMLRVLRMTCSVQLHVCFCQGLQVSRLDSSVRLTRLDRWCRGEPFRCRPSLGGAEVSLARFASPRSSDCTGMLRLSFAALAHMFVAACSRGTPPLSATLSGTSSSVEDARCRGAAALERVGSCQCLLAGR